MRSGDEWMGPRKPVDLYKCKKCGQTFLFPVLMPDKYRYCTHCFNRDVELLTTTPEARKKLNDIFDDMPEEKKRLYDLVAEAEARTRKKMEERGIKTEIKGE